MGTCVSVTPSELEANTDNSNKAKLISNSSTTDPKTNVNNPLILTSYSPKSKTSYSVGDLLEIFDLKTATWILSKVNNVKGSHIEVRGDGQIIFEDKLHCTFDRYRIRSNSLSFDVDPNSKNNNNITDIITSKKCEILSPKDVFLQSKEWKNKKHSQYPFPYQKCKCKKLKMNDHIDHRDSVGHFVLAKILDKKQNRLKIHYVGWNNKWDRWCDYNLESDRFYRAGCISERQGHRLKYLRIGDFIDFLFNNAWYYAQIKSSDKMSAQIRIVFYVESKQRTYWSHIDNECEVQPFGSKCGMKMVNSNEIINNTFNICNEIQVKDVLYGGGWRLSRIVECQYNWIKITYLSSQDEFRSDEYLHVLHHKDRIREPYFNKNNNNNMNSNDNGDCGKRDFHYKMLFKDYIVSQSNNNKKSNKCKQQQTSKSHVCIKCITNDETLTDEKIKENDDNGVTVHSTESTESTEEDMNDNNNGYNDDQLLPINGDGMLCGASDDGLLYGDAQLVELDECSIEYRNVCFEFNKTTKSSYGGYTVNAIYKIRNDELSECYQHRKYQILKSLDMNECLLNNEMLWHGTRSDVIPKIITQGFLRQFTRHAKYGRGTYFARDALYSCQSRYSVPDEDSIQFVIYCSVICGESCIGDSNMNVPNVKAHSKTKNKLYETTVNDTTNPAIFVTYKDNQALPEYLVCFRSNIL